MSLFQCENCGCCENTAVNKPPTMMLAGGLVDRRVMQIFNLE